MTICIASNGFARLSDPVTHRRKVIFIKPRFWLVIDDLTAVGSHQYDQYWHFSPEAKLVEAPDLSVIATYKHGAGLVVKPIMTDAIYVILLGDGDLKTMGDFEFDGEMLLAQYDFNGKLLDCSAAQTSLIRYKSRVLLDSIVRHKIDK